MNQGVIFKRYFNTSHIWVGGAFWKTRNTFDDIKLGINLEYLIEFSSEIDFMVEFGKKGQIIENG